MVTLIIECKAPDYSYIEEYEIEVDYESPQCCGRDMEFLCHAIDHRQEMWQCRECGDAETFYPGMYGSYFLTMNEQEYRDYQANERQKHYLYLRYGTDKPRSIRDFWF